MKRCHFIIVSAFVGVIASTFSANRVQAQPLTNPVRSYGVGIGSYSGPADAGPAIGVFPSAYPGYYGNGTSGYGPRSRTFGTISC